MKTWLEFEMRKKVISKEEKFFTKSREKSFDEIVLVFVGHKTYMFRRKKVEGNNMFVCLVFLEFEVSSFIATLQ